MRDKQQTCVLASTCSVTRKGGSVTQRWRSLKRGTPDRARHKIKIRPELGAETQRGGDHGLRKGRIIGGASYNPRCGPSVTQRGGDEVGLRRCLCGQEGGQRCGRPQPQGGERRVE
ncbi:hypothetical protein NDU88_001639 [Pleurodeles waltl]|uniref:Uncharacterized protein n=1 Tax=Pleurodeles waltl TaxID=8319 RepID=A0AAV7NBC5_PLEWA|nr:hypothetical protein NDU88_001639 [Pleurodeles waltl]